MQPFAKKKIPGSTERKTINRCRASPTATHHSREAPFFKIKFGKIGNAVISLSGYAEK